MKENQINKDNLEMESIALDSNVFRNMKFHQFFTHTKRSFPNLVTIHCCIRIWIFSNAKRKFWKDFQDFVKSFKMVKY